MASMRSGYVADFEVPECVFAVARVPLHLLDLPPTPLPATALPTKVGYLEKRGRIHKAFQQRYFVLRDNIATYYYKSDALNKPRGVIHLSSVTGVRRGSSPYVLELDTPTRTWVLQATTDADCEAWTRALCASVSYNALDMYHRRMLYPDRVEVAASDPNQVRLAIAIVSTVREVVDQIFASYGMKLDAPPLHPYDRSAYVVQLDDAGVVLCKPHQRLSDDTYVRECAKTKKTLCLTLVHSSEI